MLDKNKIFRNPATFWTQDGGKHRDIVISSRIRLARNLEGSPFPQYLNSEQTSAICQQVAKAVAKIDKGFNFYFMANLQPLDRGVLLEKHLISPELAKGKIGAGLALSKDEAVAIMVNEEDHLRIQCLYPGLQLDKAWQQANKIDDELSEELPYAYDGKLGFLTACPTNLGTGLRASVMLHLPALAMTGSINQVLNTLTKLGLAVRGLYGEGSSSSGNLFQISNQKTLGAAETDIIAHLEQVVEQVVAQEKEARAALQKDNAQMIADYCWRAYGVLRYAQILTSAEARELLSRMRLGVGMNLLPDTKASFFNQLLVAIEPAFLQKQKGKELAPAERDLARAELVRQALASATGNQE